jgi:peptidoglycan/xylan/chitin deacetylase (PgdA/CDA1 family)
VKPSLRGLAARAPRRSADRTGVALVYHRVTDRPGDPRFELLPGIASGAFAAQLSHLRRTYDVVPPSRLLEAASARQPGDRFPVAITFDDDLRSHADVVAPALLRAKVPAGFLLSGTSISGPHRFWWEDLQTLVERKDAAPSRLRSLPEVDLGPALNHVPKAIHALADSIERLPPDRRDAVAGELRSEVGEVPPALAEREIRALADAGFEIGFHTRKHYLLTTLDDDRLRAVMQDGRDRLEELAGRPLAMIAYPHGKADRRVAEAARAAGYELGFTASPEAVCPASDALLLGRVEIPSGSVRDLSRGIVSALERASARWSPLRR